MTAEGRKALVFFVVMGGLVAAGAVLFLRSLGEVAGPDAAIFTALKETEGDSLALELPGTDRKLQVSRHFFERITVEADLEARSARATATLDLEGKVGPTRLSSLGLERIPFEYREGEWAPTRGLAPLLTATVGALEARRRALEAGDEAALSALIRSDGGALEPELRRVLSMKDREYRVSAWYVRSDRGQVEVREEYRLIGATPDRPIDEKGARLLRLVEDGGEFFFASQLM